MVSALGPHNLLLAYATSCSGWGETQAHGTRIPSRSSQEAKVVLPDETARHHGNPLTPLLLGFPGTPAQRPGRCSVCGWWPPESPATRTTGLILRAAQVRPRQAPWGRAPLPLPQPAAREPCSAPPTAMPHPQHLCDPRAGTGSSSVTLLPAYTKQTPGAAKGPPPPRPAQRSQ